MLRNVVACCAIVLAFDAVASSIAKGLGFAYSSFMLPEFAMYVIIGYVLQRRAGFGAPTMVPVLVAACVESTLGWWLSIEIGVGRRPMDFGLTVFSALTSTLLFTALGALGMWAAYGFRRASKNSDVA